MYMYISLQYKDTVNVAHMYLVYIYRYMTETVFQEVSVDRFWFLILYTGIWFAWHLEMNLI